MRWLRRFKLILRAQSKSERLIFLLALAAALASGAILFGAAAYNSTAVVPTKGGDYAHGFVGQPIYVNPVLASSAIDKSLVRLIFNNVFDVADKIENASDSRAWDIRLKENLRWQDGEKLTSDDIVFTVQSIKDDSANSPLAQRFRGVAAERVSELEVRFNLVAPYAFFADDLKNLYILPKHIFADVPPANWRLSDYNLKPVGSGPYQFVSYSKMPNGFISNYVLEANDRYFGPHPLIEKLEFSFFPNNNDLIAAFNAGQVDGFGADDAGLLASLRRPHEAISFDLPDYYAVFFNQSKNLALQDIAVRQSLAWAIDKNKLVADALSGEGRRADGPIPASSPYFDGALSTSSPDLASSTLTAAGWKLGDSGVRSKKIGKSSVDLSFTLVVPQTDFLEKTAAELQNAWAAIGAKVDLLAEPLDEIAAGAVKNRDYDAILFGNSLGPSYNLFPFWHSSERFYPGLNLAVYSGKKADALMEKIRQGDDDAARAADFPQLEQAIANDYPAVFLYSPYYLYVTNKGVRGIESGKLAEAAEIFRLEPSWYLFTARVVK